MPAQAGSPITNRAVESQVAHLALILILVLTVWRVGVLFITPLGLYPEEAQYWLWSRELAFGYFSKPPMIAWLIGAATRLGGDGEGFVRLAAPLMHGLAALGVLATGRRLYGALAGSAAAALYLLMPAVQLSSLVIATDAPLLAFLSLSLLAYVRLMSAEGRGRLLWAAALGLALGLAFLSKYAALYFAGSMLIHALVSGDARRTWSGWPLPVALAAFAAAIAPNLAWNLSHGFETVAHTASNVGLEHGRHFQIASVGEFIVSQFGVFGPIPFAVLLGGTVWLARRRTLAPADLMLLIFCAPPMAIITVQAFISHANANWAAAAYVPASVLVGAWLARWGARGRPWLIATLALQGAVAVAFLVIAARPSLGDAIGLANGFKRARGWEALTGAIVERARVEQGGDALTAVVVQDRFTFNAASYYGRDAFGHDLPPLRMWLRGAHPENQAEAVAALSPGDGHRVLAVSLDPADTARMAADFRGVFGRQFVTVSLDPHHDRRAEMFVGEDFHSH